MQSEKQIYKRIKWARVVLVICVPPKGGKRGKKGEPPKSDGVLERLNGGAQGIKGARGACRCLKRSARTTEGRGRCQSTKVLTKRLAINQFANTESGPKGDTALGENSLQQIGKICLSAVENVIRFWIDFQRLFLSENSTT